MGYIFENAMYFYEYNSIYYAYSFLKHILLIVSKETYDCVVHNQKSEVLDKQLGMWKKNGVTKRRRTRVYF